MNGMRLSDFFQVAHHQGHTMKIFYLNHKITFLLAFPSGSCTTDIYSRKYGITRRKPAEKTIAEKVAKEVIFPSLNG